LTIRGNNFRDTYPYSGANIYNPNNPSDPSTIDPWNFYNRECTSYVAWKLNEAAGKTFFSNRMLGEHFGDAGNWSVNAAKLGYATNSTPAIGAVAQWNASEPGASKAGHVAYVEALNSDGTVVISEYNYHLDNKFKVRYSVRPPRFLHIRSGSTAAAPPVVSASTTAMPPVNGNQNSSIVTASALQNPQVLKLPNNAPLVANSTQAGINTPGVQVKGPTLDKTSPAAYCEPPNPFITKYGGQCTAFCWGRAKEKLDIELGTEFYGHAQTWWSQRAYRSGLDPLPNSIAVWSYYVENATGTLDHVGHVAFVEDVIDDNVKLNEANFRTYSPTNGDWGGGYDGSDGENAGPKTMKIGDMNPRLLNKRTGKTMELLGYIYLEQNKIQTRAEGNASNNRLPIIQDIVPTAPSTYSKQPQVSKPPSSINPPFPARPNMNSRSSKPERRPMMPGVSLVPDQAP